MVRSMPADVNLWGTRLHPFTSGIINAAVLMAEGGNPRVFLNLTVTGLKPQTPQA